MSDTSQGPGWWLASDGKWYPPESAPGAPPSQPEAPQWPPPGQQAGQQEGSWPPPGQQSSWPPPGQQQGAQWPPPGGPPPYGQGPYGPAGYGAPPYGGGPPPYGQQYGSQYQPSGQSVAIPDPALGLPLAPWWKRLVGGIIDAIILGVVGYILGVAGVFGSAATTGNNFNQPTINMAPLFGAWAVAGLITLLYYGLLVGSKRGQTVGMMAMSIAARDAASGAELGFWRAVLRQFVAMLLGLAFWVPFLIDCLAPLWDKRRQAWHDHASNCIVIDLKP